MDAEDCLILSGRRRSSRIFHLSGQSLSGIWLGYTLENGACASPPSRGSHSDHNGRGALDVSEKERASSLHRRNRRNGFICGIQHRHGVAKHHRAFLGSQFFALRFCSYRYDTANRRNFLLSVSDIWEDSCAQCSKPILKNAGMEKGYGFGRREEERGLTYSKKPIEYEIRR